MKAAAAALIDEYHTSTARRARQQIAPRLFCPYYRGVGIGPENLMEAVALESSETAILKFFFHGIEAGIGHERAEQRSSVCNKHG